MSPACSAVHVSAETFRFQLLHTAVRSPDRALVALGSCLLLVVLHEVWELSSVQAVPRLVETWRPNSGPVVVDLGFVYLPPPCRLYLQLPRVVLCVVVLCVCR